jgi:formylglycine-generating enzyme
MRTIFLIQILLLTYCSVNAQCYQPLYEKGKDAFSAKSYSEAISNWQDAKQCPDAPKGNDIPSRIQDARREIAAIQDAKNREDQARAEARRRDVQNKLDAQRQEEQRKEEARRKAEEAKMLAEQRKAEAEQRRLEREAEERRLEEEERQRREIAESARLARLEQIRIQEDNDFAEAKRINTDDAYLKFFGKYPFSKRIDEINQGFINAQDEKVWKMLSADNILVDYERYLKLFPKGLFAEEAKKRVVAVRLAMPEMLDVKGGKFIMGSSDGQNDERPIDEINVSDFEMSKTEITVAQFAAYVEETQDTTDAEKVGFSCVIQDGVSKNRSKVNWTCDAEGNLLKPEQFNHPVLHISWNDASRYCAWLKRKTGRYFRLPYEAEWEYAAGNGKRHTKYSWGDFSPFEKTGGNLLDASNDAGMLSKLIFEGFKDGFSMVAPVGSFDPNDFGLHDMTGNVWEWCADYYDATFYNTKPVYKNPKGSPYGSMRVMRGGGWATSPHQARVACRNNMLPEVSNYFTGFRIVVSK